jgi:hypothetical protein
MKCPTCGASTEVLDKRGPKRRRLCTAGHRFVTVETVIPEPDAPPQQAEQSNPLWRVWQPRKYPSSD